ncbi:MAG: NAD(P)-binding protein, partial [Bradymonadaceae bacterium]
MSSERAAPELPDERLEEEFGDYKPLMDEHEAVAEAERCLYCADAPCIDSCPTNIDIPEFIRRIATGNVAGSAKTILEQNILGLSCAQVCPTEVLCESTCVYNEMDEPPIDIGRLQHYATEDAYQRGLQFFEAGEPTGHRVALIGAGPASVACAHELRKRGHEAVLFEARPYPGGLNTDGVAPYKFKGDDSIREIEYVAEIGG